MPDTGTGPDAWQGNTCNESLTGQIPAPAEVAAINALSWIFNGCIRGWQHRKASTLNLGKGGSAETATDTVTSDSPPSAVVSLLVIYWETAPSRRASRVRYNFHKYVTAVITPLQGK